MKHKLTTQHANGHALAVRLLPGDRIHDPIQMGPWPKRSTWWSHEDDERFVDLNILPKDMLQHC
eukprot:7958440-Lingulodinium_polyedra.AAC.1